MRFARPRQLDGYARLDGAGSSELCDPVRITLRLYLLGMAAFALCELSIDGPEPRALAEFYRHLLGWSYAPGHAAADPEGDDWLVLLPPHGGTRLTSQRSDTAVAPWPQGARDARVAHRSTSRK